MTMPRPTMLVAATAAAFLSLGTLVVPSLAQAQRVMIGGPGGGGGFDPGVDSRQLDRYSAFLDLSADQKDAAKALLEAYQIEFDQAASEARKVLETTRQEFQETRDPSVFEEIGPKMEAFGKRRRELDRNFMSNLHDLLSEEQQQKWPALERLRRRDTSMRAGFLSGEGVDIVRLVDDLKFEPDVKAQVAPILEQYEMDVDRALQDRNALLEQQNFMRNFNFRQGITDEMRERFEKIREQSIRVQEANRRAARQIESVLPDGDRARFQSEFKERSFPRVYRSPYTMRAIESAARFDDLSSDQKKQIEELRANYSRDAAPLNERWASALEQQEKAADPVDAVFGPGPGGGGNSEVRQARDARRALDNKSLDSLKSILSTEQVERLPDRREEAEAAGDQVFIQRGR